jgi:phosphoserine phosphatase
MSDEPEVEIDLEKHFPQMRPVRGTPALSTINGCGFSLYGHRDHDPITGTYVKTQVFVLVVIPIFALKAFRVADAEGGGWYFIGREPLSGFAAGWNKLLAICLFALIGGSMWNAHNNSPAKKAERTLAEAQQVEAAGDIFAAAKTYKSLMGGPQDAAAREAMTRIVDSELAAMTPPKQAQMLDFLVRNEAHRSYRLARDYLPLGMQFAESAKTSDLKAAYAILQAIRASARAAEDPSAYQALFESVLAARVEAEPDDINLLGEYAGLLEMRNAEGDRETLIALLKPRRDKLGATEGARILAQFEAEAGNLDAALELLLPYTEARLEAYHAAEKAYEEESERAWNRGLQELEQGGAGEDWYNRYEAAGDESKGLMVQEWIAGRMEENSGLQEHRNAFIEAASVVPHAMDLGILLLQRAQTLEEADARRAELERSEAIFMSVQGAAGENPQYQLFLGQVKYWLGKSDEGEALFQQFLNSGDPEQPQFHAMLAVAGTYREVGEMAKARAIYEDVFARAEDEELKDSAANMRAITPIDVEDSILWLKRCKNKAPNVRANLASNEGQLAVQNGDIETAATKFKEALEIYKELPESGSVLNNSALVLGNLFGVTGDAKYHNEALERLAKAHGLAPDESITMSNYASHLQAAAVLAVTQDAIDYATFREDPSSGTLGALSADRATRLALQKTLIDHEHFKNAAIYHAKARILSPKSLAIYSNLNQIYNLQENVAALKQLRDDLIAAQIDHSDMNTEFLDVYAGNQDDSRLADARSSLANLQSRVQQLGETTPQTRALLHIQLSESVHSLWRLDNEADPELAIAAASTAVSTFSSQSARLTLANAYLLSCADSLVDSHPAFAKSANSARNSLSPAYLIAASLSSGSDELRAAILANARFRDALAIYKEEALEDDETFSTWLWAIARHADAEFAATIAAHIKSDTASRVSRDIALALAPLSAPATYASAWAAEIDGNPDATKGILAQAREAGIPLP